MIRIKNYPVVNTFCCLFLLFSFYLKYFRMMNLVLDDATIDFF